VALAEAGGWERLNAPLLFNDEADPVPPDDLSVFDGAALQFQQTYVVAQDVALAAVVVLDYLGDSEKQAVFALPPVMVREFALQVFTYDDLSMRLWLADELLARLHEALASTHQPPNFLACVNGYFDAWMSWTAEFDHILSHPGLGDVTDVFLHSALRGDCPDPFAVCQTVTRVLNEWFETAIGTPGNIGDKISFLLRSGSPFR
jgi:hypothetical protein